MANLSPEFTHERAKKAARTRTSFEHHVEKIVERAPALSVDQVSKLRGVLAENS